MRYQVSTIICWDVSLASRPTHVSCGGDRSEIGFPRALKRGFFAGTIALELDHHCFARRAERLEFEDMHKQEQCGKMILADAGYVRFSKVGLFDCWSCQCYK